MGHSKKEYKSLILGWREYLLIENLLIETNNSILLQSFGNISKHFTHFINLLLPPGFNAQLVT